MIKEIIALKNHGSYASYLIKKIIYWPKFINFEATQLYMDDKEVVTKALLTGKLDGITFDVSLTCSLLAPLYRGKYTYS